MPRWRPASPWRTSAAPTRPGGASEQGGRSASRRPPIGRHTPVASPQPTCYDIGVHRVVIVCGILAASARAGAQVPAPSPDPIPEAAAPAADPKAPLTDGRPAAPGNPDVPSPPAPTPVPAPPEPAATSELDRALAEQRCTERAASCD